MSVNEDEFKRVIRNMLNTPPKKHSEAKYPRKSRSEQNKELQANIDKAVAKYRDTENCLGMSEEQVRFEACLNQVFSVSKKELNRRLAEEKKRKQKLYRQNQEHKE